MMREDVADHEEIAALKAQLATARELVERLLYYRCCDWFQDGENDDGPHSPTCPVGRFLAEKDALDAALAAAKGEGK